MEIFYIDLTKIIQIIKVQIIMKSRFTRAFIFIVIGKVIIYYIVIYFPYDDHTKLSPILVDLAKSLLLAIITTTVLLSLMYRSQKKKENAK